MTETVLNQALRQVLDEEIAIYENTLAKEPAHRFSSRYLHRKRQILQGDIYPERMVVHHRSSGSRRRLVMLVAVLVMLFALTATVIAFVKPPIYYEIKDRFTHWIITTTDSETTATETFEPFVLPAPAGFEIVYEHHGPELYDVQFRNEQGVEISYLQSAPRSTTFAVDSERNDFRIETYNGHDIYIAFHDNVAIMLFDDGTYVYQLSGDCGEDELRKLVEYIIDHATYAD